MGGDQGERDERSHDELYRDLLKADWNISSTGYSTYGATVVFRKHYTSDFPGMETRTVHGKDEDDAIRIFLKQLEEEQGADGSN